MGKRSLGEFELLVLLAIVRLGDEDAYAVTIVDEIVERGHDRELVHRIEHLLYIAEYKRRQAAPGVKITRKNFGRDRRYPITNKYRDRS